MWFLFAIFLTKFFAHQATGQKANSTNQNYTHSAHRKAWLLVACLCFHQFQVIFPSGWICFFFSFRSFLLSNSLLRFLSLCADNDATDVKCTCNFSGDWILFQWFLFGSFFFAFLPNPLLLHQYLSVVLVGFIFVRCFSWRKWEAFFTSVSTPKPHQCIPVSCSGKKNQVELPHTCYIIQICNDSDILLRC